MKRTRKLLRDAFNELLAEKSFQAISVQDVAARATVNRATFYAHYQDKYALLDEVIGEYHRAQLGRRLPLAARFSVGNLHLLIRAVFDTLAEFHDHCKPTLRDIAPLIEARVQREIRAVLARWLGEPPPASAPRPVTRETAAEVLSWAIFGAGLEWARGARTTPASEMASQVLDLITGGLSSAGLPSAAGFREHQGQVAPVLAAKA
ncbi:MAG TPA: TetR family transcriptional regulator [Chloroflexota bacterium]|nr:TetR family transcriptional regulator [Chloroflexota bacterium]